MVINSPCLIDNKELTSPKKTALGKDFSNLFIVDSLLKTIWFINAPCYCNEALAIPGQTATGKELSNPLMAKVNSALSLLILVDQRTIANGNQELLATIDCKEYTITEASVKSSIQLADASGTSNLPDADIYEGLATMGYVIDGNHVPLLPAMLASSQGPSPNLVTDEATTTSVEVEAKGAATTTTSLEAGLDSGNIHESPLKSHDAPLLEVNTSGSAEDSVKLKELMELVPKLVLRIDYLDKELAETKQRVTTLKVAQKNSSKQGRKSHDDRSEDFVTPLKVSASGEAQEQEISPTLLDVAKTLTQVASRGVHTYKRRRRSIEERIESEEVNIGRIPVKSASPLEQEKAGLEEAIKLQAQIDAKVAEHVYKDEMIAKRIEEETQLIDQQKQIMAQVQFEAQYYTEEDWDVIRAKIEANAELVKNIQGEDLSKEYFSKRMVDMINQRKKHFAEQRAKAKRSKPMTQTRLRNYMSNYLKNQGTWKLSQVKKLTFEEVKEEFDKLVEQIETFVPMRSVELQEKVVAKDVPVTEENAADSIAPKEE
ncbi:hypothetical protein Tco_0089383 [Tanacetum coccineum]